MFGSGTRKVLAITAALASVAIFLANPAQATSDHPDTLIFAPYKGQTYTLWSDGLVSTPAYVTAQQTFEGDFSGTPGRDLFLYTPGPAADGILHITPTEPGISPSFTPLFIIGNYKPLVGDFDGNGIDDIFWYAPGTASDSIWLFKADGTHTTKPFVVNGNYRPTVINVDGDGYDDIIWYGPGTAADSIWRFGPGASRTTKAVSISGDYQLIPGYFSLVAEGSPQQRLIFFAKAGPDSIWTFDTSANHTSAPLPNIDGNFKPVVGNFLDGLIQQVLFYRPGPGSERFIGFTSTGALNQYEAPNVSGNYDPAVGNFNGDGYDDIAWGFSGKANLWYFNGSGYTTGFVSTLTPNTMPAVVHIDSLS